MASQKLTSSVSEQYAKIHDPDSVSLIPISKQFDQCYQINRVKQSSIYVSEDARNKVLDSLSSGKMFVQIGKYTVMLNTISSIEPLPLRDKDLWEREEARRLQYEQMRKGFEVNAIKILEMDESEGEG